MLSQRTHGSSDGLAVPASTGVDARSTGPAASIQRPSPSSARRWTARDRALGRRAHVQQQPAAAGDDVGQVLGEPLPSSDCVSSSAWL